MILIITMQKGSQHLREKQSHFENSNEVHSMPNKSPNQIYKRVKDSKFSSKISFSVPGIDETSEDSQMGIDMTVNF